MPTFKKFTGNYPTVIDAIDLPKVFYDKSKSRDAYNQVVEVDVPRGSYINFNGKVQNIIERLTDTQHLKDEDLSYTQGNFWGSIFTGMSIQLHGNYTSTTMKAGEEGTLKNYTNDLAFTYIDDEGNLCGLSIWYLRDDSDQNIPVDKRSLPFTVAVIKNVNQAPQKREVTYFTHHSFLSKKAHGGEDLEADKLIKELEKATNCQAVNQLLTGIIKKDSIALDLFLDLKNNRLLKGKKNIDDRDVKLDTLFELFVIWAQLANDGKQSEEKDNLMKELTSVINHAYQDVNYFKNKSLDDVKKMVSAYQENPLISSLPAIKNADVVKQLLMEVVQTYQTNITAAKAQLNKELDRYASGYSDASGIKSKLEQSFLQRNLANLVLVTISLFAIISLALTLTGIFAPIGLALVAGLAVTLAITSIVAAERTIKIVNNEKQINGAKEIIKTYDEKVEKLCTQEYREALHKIARSINSDDTTDTNKPKMLETC